LNILTFGQSGQLAQALRSSASGRAFKLTCLGRDQCDVTRIEEVSASLDFFKPDAVINAAAYTAVDMAETEQAAANALNCLAPQFMAKLTAARNIPFIHLSTDYVFDGQKHSPYKEKDPTGPINQYGITKRNGEIAVLKENPAALILRTSWIFSPFGHNFVRTIIKRALEGATLSVVDDQIGCPTSALDLGAACLFLAKAKIDGDQGNGIYHFASSGEISWFGFAQAIVDEIALWPRVSEPKLIAIQSSAYAAKAIRPKNSRLNCDLFAATFNYPLPHWRDSLITTLGLLKAEFGAIS
jgi:dTDP-4-dehydrorhamnose reductase